MKSTVQENDHMPKSIARLLNRLVFISLLATIVLTAVPYGAAQLWWIAVFECGVFATAMLAVIEASFSKDYSIKHASLFVPLALLVLFALFQSLPLFAESGPESFRKSLSADPYSSRLFAIRLLALILFALLMLRYVSSPARLRKLIYVVIGVGVASAVFGITRKTLQQADTFLWFQLPPNGRNFGQFVNRNHFAFLLEMVLGLTLGVLVGQKFRSVRTIVLLGITILLWMALIYSNSRGGIIASLCQVIFLGMLLDPVKYLTQTSMNTRWVRVRNLAGGTVLRIFLLLCLAVVFAYGVGWVGGESVVSNFQMAASDFNEQETQDNANTSRKQIWSATWQMIKAHPVAGVGFGGYWIGITKYHQASGEITPQQAHNDYLEALASGGIIGCALIVWFLMLLIRRASLSIRSADSYGRAASLGALVGLFGVGIHSFVDFGLHITVNLVILFVLIVIGVTNNRLPGTSTNSPLS